MQMQYLQMGIEEVELPLNKRLKTVFSEFSKGEIDQHDMKRPKIYGNVA